MHILKVIANGFKGCADNFTISFVPEANKTEDDKEFELIEIADDLFVYSTVGIVGKNASGKTSVVDLLGLVYDIFSSFRVSSMKRRFLYWNKNVNLDITFYHDDYLYRYVTDVVIDEQMLKTVIFKNQKLFKRPFFKSYVKDKSLFDYTKYEEVLFDSSLPEDLALIYSIFKKMEIAGLYYSIEDERNTDYVIISKIYNMFSDNGSILTAVLKLFDESLEKIKLINDNKFEIIFTNKKSIKVDSTGLSEYLSSGTSKGFDLYSSVLYCLKAGKVLIVDEIENHFHKTLVENLINLFKDKSVNKSGAVLIFTTHYCELLDLFNRTDNIFVTKHFDKVTIENVYEKYDSRNDVLKSRKFYNNAFGTNVNYELLMNFKRELMK